MAENFPWKRIALGWGEAMPRIDAREKVLGTGKYPDDIYLDGMIYGSAVRSKYPPGPVYWPSIRRRPRPCRVWWACIPPTISRVR